MLWTIESWNGRERSCKWWWAAIFHIVWSTPRLLLLNVHTYTNYCPPSCFYPFIVHLHVSILCEDICVALIYIYIFIYLLCISYVYLSRYISGFKSIPSTAPRPAWGWHFSWRPELLEAAQTWGFSQPIPIGSMVLVYMLTLGVYEW